MKVKTVRFLNSKNADDAFNSDPDRPVFDDHDSGQ